MAARKGPPVEADVRRTLANLGGASTRFIARQIQRDELTVRRCLRRMRSRGQVVSSPAPFARYALFWRLA